MAHLLGHKGIVNYNSGIVKGIVTLAISEIEGVEFLNVKNKGIKLDFDKNNVYADISVAVVYGYNVPDVAFKIQEAIKDNVENMSKYKVAKVNVHVHSVVNNEELG